MWHYFFQTTIRFKILFLLGLVFCSCNEEENYPFRIVTPSESGIDFSNDITETESLNILNFHYIYNGGGVGVGDFNKDGFPDLVFSGNQVPSKIYLNQIQPNKKEQNFKFKDITQLANFTPKGWTTGISIIDINEDGWQDIYISVGGYQCEGNCNNQLFIHQGLDENGIPKFEEQAKKYGLDDGLYTQQAAFFDYDMDGDLDVYLLRNLIDRRDKNAPIPKRYLNKNSIDQLLENKGNNRFMNVSDAMGIIYRGYGLGITINDFNNDNLPDIYIANDFLSDDLMYLNRGLENGNHLGFEEAAQQQLKHTSYNAMGVDVADVNNDALADIVVLDMLPEYNERQKTMLGFMNYNKFLFTLKEGYMPQFVRNTLQIHNGFLNGDLLPFSEVGYLSGIYNTDWSWTPLLADFDNDTDRDLYVTNGYGKDITDLDFMNFSNQRNPFGTQETKQKELFDEIQKMESVTMPNYIFENEGQLNFQKKNGAWTKKQNSISNGAAYADLDNDGDLDLIVNNIDEPAFILENKLRVNAENNYLKIQLTGTTKNPSAIGAKIYLWSATGEQYFFQSPVRGYLSTVTDVAHFGLGENEQVDSIKIIWPNEQIEILYNIDANQTLELSIKNAKSKSTINKKEASSLFASLNTFTTYIHQENIHQDFNTQPLLLHQYSAQGPCLAVANIDGQPGDELFIGGAKGYPGQLFFQKADGTYQVKKLPHSSYEDTAASFFDHDKDGDLDLYIVSGGTELNGDENVFQDRLYLNDGKGNFNENEAIKMPPRSSGSCVRPNDFDKDGDVDLFVGARLEAQKYPQIPTSFLMLNHKGKLLDFTNKLAHPLEQVGMVADAIWADIDGDEWDDLILVGEWMEITIYKNDKGHLSKMDNLGLDHSKGFWNCIAAGDFDKDGDTDFLLGNLGNNSRLQASVDEPLKIYTKDFDNNGSQDPLIGQFYLNKTGTKKIYPVHNRDDVVGQLPSLKKTWLKYSDFSKASFVDLLKTDLNSSDFLTANYLQSAYLENKGNKKFELQALPQAVQLAPIQNILVDDFDGDGNLDALMTGNNFTSEKNNGWYDAFNGLYLRGDGKGNFEAVATAESGFYVPRDGRDIVKMTDKDGKQLIVAGQNSDKLQVFEIFKNNFEHEQ